MDPIFLALHNIMPVLYVLAGLAFIFKIILVVSNKGFDVPAMLASFFRIYRGSQRTATASKKRQTYMKFNNFINYYIYIVLVLFFLLLIIYQGRIFDYS